MFGNCNLINQNKYLHIDICSPVDGDVIPLNQIDDPYFKTGKLGQGAAIIPQSGKIYAPADSTVAAIFNTGHAIILKTYSGVDLLIHIGIDTVKLKGKGFKIHCQKDDNVQTGDLLIEVDLDLLKSQGYNTTIPIIVCNSEEYSDIILKNFGYVNALTSILTLQTGEDS